MNLKKTILFVTVTFLITNSLQAQFWKKLEKKAKQKSEEKLNKETDKLLDKVINPSKKKEKESQTGNFVFTGSVTLEITSDGEKANFDVLFNSNKEMFCIHLNTGDGQNVYNVISPKSGTMFMNASGMKIKKNIPSDQFSNMDYSDKVPKKEDLKKTGNTKSILGYFCEEYVYENDGGKVVAWVAKNFPIASKYAPMLGMTKNKVLDGFTLELNYVTKNGENSKIQVIKVDKNKKIVINASEYNSI